MFRTGMPIEMTKGYKGIRGIIQEITDSEHELYVLKLDNGIHLVAGPQAFIPAEKESGD